MSLKRGTKWRLVITLTVNIFPNGDKLSVQFPKVGKSTQSQSNNSLVDHQLLKINRNLGIQEMKSKEIYFFIISSKVSIPTSQIYFEEKFSFYNFQWKDIYRLLRKVTINAYLRSFQYTILNNLLYLHTFDLSNTQLWFFQKMDEETVGHLLYYCTHIQDIWIKFKLISLTV